MTITARDLLTAKPSNNKESHKHRQRFGGGDKWLGHDAGYYDSDALGVHPDQIPEAIEYYRKCGIAAEFNADGSMRLRTQKQVRDICRASGMFTGRDGYGVMDENGVMRGTGRAQENEKAEIRRVVDRAVETGEWENTRIRDMFEGIV